MVYIRSLAENEMEFLQDMMYESIHIPEDKPPRDVLLNLPHLKKYKDDWGRRGDRALVAVNNDNQAIAAVWYRLFDEQNKGYGYINNCTPEIGIAVSKEARGMGIGSILLHSIIKQAMVDGYKSISLSVDPKNENAVHIYKKQGFKEYGLCGTSITMVYTLPEQ
ncbi:GNAT family N-acetyltransferase [Bacillus sp. FSL K6-3431]|uniref:GNAT family N-acetyltransferase n=1 Tax=Bacillus sp. FSL K6-3431 TaxID=2921500 RepID=UPI0030F9A6CF